MRVGVVMPFYFISLILLIINFILTVVTIRAEKKKLPAVFLGISILSTISSFLTMKVPEPEIYTTNGNSTTDNVVYCRAEFPLKIYYTLLPYSDPKKNGKVFIDSIPVNNTMTISAKATLFGLKWSELVSLDIVVGDNHSVNTIWDVIAGSSVKEINVTIMKNRLFPGDRIMKDDLRVEGTTIFGEKILLENYRVEPDVVREGYNEIQIQYMNLSQKLNIYVTEPSLIELDVKYNGDAIHVGDEIIVSDFDVQGFYEDGSWKKENTYRIFPLTFEDSGSQTVTISVGDIEKPITLDVQPKEYLLNYINELHTPNGGYDPNVSLLGWEENENYTIDGKTYSDGFILKIDNWMSGMMGNGNDFAEDVESRIYLSVNQEVANKRVPEERYMNGRFVIERNTNGSTTTANISILADDIEVYNSGEITSVTTNIPEFHVNLDKVNTIVIKTNANSKGRAFLLGIIVD